MMKFTIRHINKLPSTNSRLQEYLLREEVREGFVLWADEQTAGRGHGQNHWESETGKNLTFSVLLRPSFIAPENQFLLTQIVSLAIARAIKDILPLQKVSIKWPNDIYIGNKKVAGILIQNFIKGAVIDYSIVGIGLNVNQTRFLSDAPNPVSLIHFTKKATELSSLLDALILHLGGFYTQSTSILGQEEIGKKYLSLLFRYHQPAIFRKKKEEFQAVISGIGKFGQLILQLENGEEKLYAFKEVEFVI